MTQQTQANTAVGLPTVLANVPCTRCTFVSVTLKHSLSPVCHRQAPVQAHSGGAPSVLHRVYLTIVKPQIDGIIIAKQPPRNAGRRRRRPACQPPLFPTQFQTSVQFLKVPVDTVKLLKEAQALLFAFSLPGRHPAGHRADVSSGKVLPVPNLVARRPTVAKDLEKLSR